MRGVWFLWLSIQITVIEMGNLSLGEDPENGKVAGFFNSSNSIFVLQTVEPSLNMVKAASGSSNYVGESINNYLSGQGQGNLESTMNPDNCFGCSDYRFDDGAISFGNHSNSSGYWLYHTTTVSILSTIVNAEDEHTGLYVMPWALTLFWCILYLGISATALVGNILVMWVVAISRRMRTVTNMFIANLALADFIIGLFTIPFQFQAALLQRWNLPHIMCAVCPFVQVLSVNVSVFTLSAIAMDRYKAVLFPLKPRVSKRKAAWAILTIWTMAFLIALPTWLDYKVTEYHDPENGETKPFCSNMLLDTNFRMYYSLALLVIQYILPLIILSGAYIHMTTKLWGTTVPGNKEESRDAVVLRNKKKVIKMLAVVVLLFAVCWLPLQMYNVLQIFIPSINSYKYINIVWFCFHSLAMSNSCCNPFIYAIYNDKFQREFRARLRCILLRWCDNCKRRSDDNDSNNSDGSDFDGTRVRQSFRLKSNTVGRLGSKHNRHNTYSAQSKRRQMTTELNEGNNSVKCDKKQAGDCDDNQKPTEQMGYENERQTLSTKNDLYGRNNNQSRKFNSSRRTKYIEENENAQYKLENEKHNWLVSNTVIQVDSHVEPVPSKTETGVVCPYSKRSSNTSKVKTIIAEEKMYQL